jgi:AraC-like DNA-binding protein
MSKKADDLSSRVVNTAERSDTRLYLWFKVSSGREVTASQVGCAEFLRMEKAAELLSNTSLPINEVASKVGYPDPLAFSKKFKESYGMSPKAYRESSPEISAQNAKGGFDPSYL